MWSCGNLLLDNVCMCGLVCFVRMGELVGLVCPLTPLDQVVISHMRLRDQGLCEKTGHDKLHSLNAGPLRRLLQSNSGRSNSEISIRS